MYAHCHIYIILFTPPVRYFLSPKEGFFYVSPPRTVFQVYEDVGRDVIEIGPLKLFLRLPTIMETRE